MSNEAMLLALVKPFLPKLKGYLSKCEEALKKYLESVPLQGEETHAAAFTEISEGTVYIVIGAFTDKTFTRFISAEPLSDWLNNLIQNSFKNGNGK